MSLMLDDGFDGLVSPALVAMIATGVSRIEGGGGMSNEGSGK